MMRLVVGFGQGARRGGHVRGRMGETPPSSVSSKSDCCTTMLLPFLNTSFTSQGEREKTQKWMCWSVRAGVRTSRNSTLAPPGVHSVPSNRPTPGLPLLHHPATQTADHVAGRLLFSVNRQFDLRAPSFERQGQGQSPRCSQTQSQGRLQLGRSQAQGDGPQREQEAKEACGGGRWIQAEF